MTSKEKACAMISRMPEESTFEDIRHHLYALECIERGEREIEDGKALTHQKWRTGSQTATMTPGAGGNRRAETALRSFAF